MALKLYTGKNSDIKVYASDWRLFVKELNKIDPQQIKNLKKRWKEIAAPAQQGVREELGRLGTAGPMSGMRHGGRTGWGTNYGRTGGALSGVKRKPYNSVGISAMTRSKKGATGIARLVVRSAGVVYADLAQKASGQVVTREYRIRLFGGPEIIRKHQIRPGAVSSFLSNLGPISKPSKRRKSRDVYPGFDKSYPAVKVQAEEAIKETIRFVKQNIDRNNRA
jgi:hypothetical protein